MRMKNTDIKVEIEFTEGYESRYTRACLKRLEQRNSRRKQKGPPVKNVFEQKEPA